MSEETSASAESSLQTRVKVLAPEDVSGQVLGELLEDAVIDFRLISDERLYVSGGLACPMWIDLVPDLQLIRLNNYVELNPEVPEEDYFKFANKLNASGYFPSFHVYKQRMYADLVINYRDGLIARQFVRWCRLYSSEMVSWLNRFQAEQAQTMKQTTGDSGPELFIFPWHQSQEPADASPVMLN